MSRQHLKALSRGYEAMNLALASGEDLAPLLADFAPDIVVEMGACSNR